MIEVFDTTAAGRALARRKLACPGCGQALRPWGRARERTVREVDGGLVTVRPDRARCTGCRASALDALGAAAMAMGDRFGLQHTSPWARVTVLTRGQLLDPSPAG